MLALAMGTLLGVWGLVAGICVALGVGVLRGFGVERALAIRGFQAFWLGFAAMLVFLQVWHLFAPIGPAAAAVLGAAGLGIALNERANWWTAAGLAGALRANAVVVLGSLALAIWIANLAVRGVEHYDTGLYLLGGTRWAASNPVVAGLANLHGRFGYNNAHLLYGALLGSGPLADRVPNLVNGSLLVVLLAQSLACARRLIAGAGRPAGDAFGLVLAVPALILAKFYLVSLSTDLPATLLSMLVAWWCFRVLAGEEEGREREALLSISLLAAASVSVKLSSLVFVGGCWGTLAVWLLTRGCVDRRQVGLALLVGCLAVTPWLVRGVILSGYPLYPSTALSLPVEWRLPAEQAIREMEWVLAWARVPGVPRELVLEGWYWLDSWTARHLHVSLVPSFPLPLLLGAAGSLAVATLRTRGSQSSAEATLWLWAPCAAGFVFWFLKGPDPRFAMFVFWSLAATGLAAAAGSSGVVGGRVVAVVALGLALASAPKDLVEAGPDGGFHPIPRVDTKRVETLSGLALNVPVDTDLCWDAPLPCTPHPRPSLAARRNRNPQTGFVRSDVAFATRAVSAR